MVSDLPLIPTETWVNNRWRPAMAWSYFCVCICDFIVFPAVNAGVAATTGVYHEWHPLTLQGGGLYHLAMGGIIGIAAWQRTNEKMAIMGSPGFGASAERVTDTVVPEDEPTKPGR